MPERKWLLKDISFVFLSANNKPDSVLGSIDSFLTSRDDDSVPANCSVNSFSSSSKRNHAGVRLEQVFPLLPSSGESILDYTERINLLFFDLLKRDIPSPTRAWCICYEDITFRKGFIEKMLESLNEVASREGSNFILSTYASRDLAASPALRRGRFYIHYPAGDFFGAHCLVITSDCVAELRAYYLMRGWNQKIPYDILINHYARSRENVFCTVSSLVQHSGRYLAGSGGFQRSSTFARPWPIGRVTLAEYQVMAENALRSTHPLQPGHRKHNRGIVICAGGDKYFTCAWIATRILRRLGCKLPIEFWHLGPQEMTAEMKSLAEGVLEVKCVDAYEVRKKHPVRTLNGWELKCYAIIHTAFREVLLLDADNIVVKDPTFLFRAREYKKTGAIFWPDVGSLGPERDIWEITDVPYNSEPDFESGQIVVDKERCWYALNLAMHYNEHSDFYYQHIYGDKDTFRFAFLKTRTPFSMPPRRIEVIDGTLCQHDFRGRRVFQHRIKKWSLRGKNKPTDGFLHEAECLAALDELRALWPSGYQADEARTKLLIPRVIHQLWLDPRARSLKQLRWARTWRRLHPHWEVREWTEENLPDLLNQAEYNAATNLNQRREIVSYELLHRFGGVYVDAQFECLHSLENLLIGEECVIGEESPGRVCHGLIACVPGHEFIKRLVRGLPTSIKTQPGKSAVEQSGVNYFTRTLRDRRDVTVLPAGYFHTHSHAEAARAGADRVRGAGAYATHHDSPEWHPKNGVTYLRRFVCYTPEGKSPRELTAAQRLTTSVYDYHRIGYDRRSLEFLPDGAIGGGAATCENSWDLWEENGVMHLTISGVGYVTCRLQKHEDDVWRGVWEIAEKMPVELIRSRSKVSLRKRSGTQRQSTAASLQ